MEQSIKTLLIRPDIEWKKDVERDFGQPTTMLKPIGISFLQQYIDLLRIDTLLMRDDLVMSLLCRNQEDPKYSLLIQYVVDTMDDVQSNGVISREWKGIAETMTNSLHPMVQKHVSFLYDDIVQHPRNVVKYHSMYITAMPLHMEIKDIKDMAENVMYKLMDGQCSSTMYITYYNRYKGTQFEKIGQKIIFTMEIIEKSKERKFNHSLVKTVMNSF